jgi:hypothetical protein
MKSFLPACLGMCLSSVALSSPLTTLSLGEQQLSHGEKTTVLTQVGVSEYIKVTHASAGFQAGLDVGLALASGGGWTDSEYFGGVVAGYKFLSGTEVGAAANASVLYTTYKGRNSNHGGVQYALYVTQDFSPNWAGKVELKSTDYAPYSEYAFKTTELLLGAVYNL